MPVQRPPQSPPTDDNAVSHLNNARQIAVLLKMAVETSPSISDALARKTILDAVEGIDSRIVRAIAMLTQ